MPTQFTDLNLSTSVSGFLANAFVDYGWGIYWHARDLLSGTGKGPITIVPEMPPEADLLVLPPRPDRTPQEIVIPAFAVTIGTQPFEEIRVGIGESIFRNRVGMLVEGFVVDQAQHMFFATILRNIFKPDYRIPIWDWESNPTTPELIDHINTYVDSRTVDRVVFPDLPQPAVYYISCSLEIIFYD